MEISIKVSGIKEALERYPVNIVAKAARSALQKTATTAVNRIKRKITDEYNIKTSRISKLLYISKKASANSLNVSIYGLGAGLKLGYFDARQAGKSFYRIGKGKRGLKRGRGVIGDVTVEVKKGTRKKVGGEPGFMPFLAQLRSGHVGVFIRGTKKRKPILEMFGPGVAGLLKTKKFRDEIEGKFIPEKFKEIFAHELEFYSKK